MPTLSLLLAPSFNRLYTKQAPDVVATELAVLDRLVLDGALGEPRLATRGGAPFLDVDVPDGVGELGLTLLRNLSGTFVVFDLAADGSLRPVEAAPLVRYDDDLLTTLRYSGKTNEQLTHLLVNVALAATDDGWPRLLAGERLCLLDPLAGRGTTLNQGLQYGMDVVGIEAHEADVDAYHRFVTRWLQDHRAKHASKAWRYTRGGEPTAHRATTTITRTPDGERIDQVVGAIHDDTTNAREHLKRSSIDLLATDLPYGVQHGARSEAWGRSRSPEALLDEALPVWREVLRGGGGMAIAWNRRNLPRADLVALLDAHRFEVVEADDDALAHRVDRTIQRDVVIARKPS